MDHNVSIFVRRAGPNYQEGLRKMREIGGTLGIPLFVFGPETHMTAICGMALGKRTIPKSCNADFATANFLLPSGQQQAETDKSSSSATMSSSSVTVPDSGNLFIKIKCIRIENYCISKISQLVYRISYRIIAHVVFAITQNAVYNIFHQYFSICNCFITFFVCYSFHDILFRMQQTDFLKIFVHPYFFLLNIVFRH